MNPRYFIKNQGPHAPLYFDQADKLMLYLYLHHRGQEAVKVYVEGMDLHIRCNMKTNDIAYISETNSKHIINHLSPALFPAMTHELHNALLSVTKLSLLHELEKLGDEKISQIIRRRHFHEGAKEATPLSLINIEKTLKEIEDTVASKKTQTNKSMLGIGFFSPNRSQANPLHQAIYLHLQEKGGINNIQSLHEVNDLMQRIHSAIAPSSASPSSRQI